MHLGFFTVVLCLLHCCHVVIVGSQPSVIPGYLDFDNLPETNFSCQKKVIGGYYADIETGCQMFHVCTIGQKGEVTDIKFLCLNGTVFDQETRVCERVDEVDCSQAEEFFDLNLELYGSNIPFGFPSEDDETPSGPDEQESKKEESTTHPSTTTTTTTTTTPAPTTTTTTTTTPRPTFPSTTRKPSTSLPSLHFLSITTHRPPTYNAQTPQQQNDGYPSHQQNIRVSQQQHGGSTQRNPNSNNNNYQQTVSTTLPTVSYTSPRYPISKPDINKGAHHGHFPLSPSPGVATLLAIRNNFNNGNGNGNDNDDADRAQFEDDLEDYESSGNGGEFEEEDEEEEEEEEIVINRPGPHANRFPVTTIGNDNVRIENNGAVRKGQPVNGHSAFTESLAQRNRQSIPHGNQGYAYHRKNPQHNNHNNQYGGGNNGYDSDDQNSDVHAQHRLTTDYILGRQKENEKHQHHGGGFNSNNQFSYSTSTPTSSHFYHQQNGAVFSSTIQPYLLPPLLKAETDASEYESQKIGRQVQQPQNGGSGAASLLKRKLEEEIHHQQEAAAAHSHHSAVKFQPNKAAPVNPLFTTPSVAIVSQTSSTSFVSSISRAAPATRPTTPSNGTILGISTVTSVGTVAGQHNPHNLTIDASVFRQKHVETTPPASYDEYLEGDVQKDPFYIDVPRIASKKRQKRRAETGRSRELLVSKRNRVATHTKSSLESVVTSYPDLSYAERSTRETDYKKDRQKKTHGHKSSEKSSVKGRKIYKSSKKNRKNRSYLKDRPKIRNTRETDSLSNLRKRQVVADTAAGRSADIQFQTGEHVSVSASPSHYVSRSKVERKNPNLRSLVSFQNRQRVPQTSKSLITEAIFETRRPSDEGHVDTSAPVATPAVDVPTLDRRQAISEQSPKESQRTSGRLRPSLIPDPGQKLTKSLSRVGSIRGQAHNNHQQIAPTENVSGTVQPPVELPQKSSGRGGISLEAFGPSVSRRKVNKTPSVPENRPRAVNTPASTFLANYPVEMVELKTKSHMVAMVPTHNRVSLDFLRSLETKPGDVDSTTLPTPHRNSRRPSAVSPTRSAEAENQRRIPQRTQQRQGRQRNREDTPSSTLASHRVYNNNVRSRPATTPLPDISANQNVQTQFATEPSMSAPVTQDDQMKTVSLESSTSGQDVVSNPLPQEQQQQTYETVSILDVPPVTNPTMSPRTSKRQRARDSSQQTLFREDFEPSRPRHNTRNAQRGSSSSSNKQISENVDIPSRIATGDTFQSRRTPNAAAAVHSPEVNYKSTTDVPLSPRTSPSRSRNRGSYRARISADEIGPTSRSETTPSRRGGEARRPSSGAPGPAQQQPSESQVSAEMSSAPTQAPLPVTSFTCADKVPGGYYADLEADCQLFHICSQGRHGRNKDNKFLCGPGTRFNQETRTCQSRDLVDCGLSASLYHLNNHFTLPAAEVEVPPAEPKFEPRKLRRGRTKRSTIEAIDTAEDTNDRIKRQTEIPYYEEDYDFEDLSYETGDDRVGKSAVTTIRNVAPIDKTPKQLGTYEEYFFVDYVDSKTTKKPKTDANIRTLEPFHVSTVPGVVLADVDYDNEKGITTTRTTTLDADYYLENDYVNDNYEPVTYNLTSTTATDTGKKNVTHEKITIDSSKNPTSLPEIDVQILVQSNKRPLLTVDKVNPVPVTPPTKASINKSTAVTVDKVNPVPVTPPTKGSTNKHPVVTADKTKPAPVTPPTKASSKPDYYDDDDYYYYDEPVADGKVTNTKEVKSVKNPNGVGKSEKIKKDEQLPLTTVHSADKRDEIADFENEATESDVEDVEDTDVDDGKEGKIDVNQIFFTTVVPEAGDSLDDILNGKETEPLSTLGPLPEETGNPLDAIREVVYRLLDDENMFDDNSTDVGEEATGGVAMISTTVRPETVATTLDVAEMATTEALGVEVTTTLEAITTEATTLPPTTTTTTTTETTTTTTTTAKPKRKSNRNRYLTTTTGSPITAAFPSTIQSLFQRTRSRPTPKYNHDDIALPVVHIKSVNAMTTRRPPLLRSRNHFNKIRQQNHIGDENRKPGPEDATTSTTLTSNSVDDSDAAKSSVHATRVTIPMPDASDSEEAFSTLIPSSITPVPKSTVTLKTTIADDELDVTTETSTKIGTTSSTSSEVTPPSRVANKTRPRIKEVQSGARNDEPSLKILQSFARMQDETFYPEEVKDTTTTIVPEVAKDYPEVVLVKDGRGFSNNEPTLQEKNLPYDTNRKSRFSCTDKEMYQYYPDPEDTRIFHYCSPGFHNRQKLDFLFICDHHTIFNVQSQRCE